MSTERKIAFLFPGQGSQAVGMGRDLCENFASARSVFEDADRVLEFPLSRLCFEGPEDQLKLTENTQPAILTVSIAAQRVLAERGIHAQATAGHSLGEYSAYVAAGTLTFAEAVAAVRKRGRYMQEAVPAGEGAMAAILGLEAGQVREICAIAERETGGVVSPANMNAPAQIVISGAAAAVAAAMELAKERGASRTVTLPVSAPFHCSLMHSAQERLAEDLKAIDFRDPGIPVVSNVDAAWAATGEVARDGLIRQVTGAVRWVECEQRLIDAGVTHWIEVGPGRVLTGLLRQLDRGRACLSASNVTSMDKTAMALSE